MEYIDIHNFILVKKKYNMFMLACLCWFCCCNVALVRLGDTQLDDTFC